MKTQQVSNERGFTLIEMLVVIGILGVLMGLGITTLRSYRASASNTAAKRTVQDALTDVEGALNNVDQNYAVVTFSQSSTGPLLDPDARSALSTFYVPKNTSFDVSFDPTCDNNSCTQVFLQASHCFGNAAQQYMRLGDGVSLNLEVAHAGC